MSKLEDNDLVVMRGIREERIEEVESEEWSFRGSVTGDGR